MTLTKLIKTSIGGGVMLISIASAIAVQAASIPNLFNTGVNSFGNPLPLGVQDPHYIVLENNNSNAFTLSSPPIAYLPNNSTSQWIWQQANAQPAAGTRTLRTTFNLTGLNPSTASISGQWAADNFLDAILINGVSIGPIPNDPFGVNFTSFKPFNINSGFIAGLNTLDFKVRGDDFVASALRVELKGTAQPVPESSTVLGLGLLGLSAFFKHKLADKS